MSTKPKNVGDQSYRSDFEFEGLGGAFSVSSQYVPNQPCVGGESLLSSRFQKGYDEGDEKLTGLVPDPITLGPPASWAEDATFGNTVPGGNALIKSDPKHKPLSLFSWEEPWEDSDGLHPQSDRNQLIITSVNEGQPSKTSGMTMDIFDGISGLNQVAGDLIYEPTSYQDSPRMMSLTSQKNLFDKFFLDLEKPAKDKTFASNSRRDGNTSTGWTNQEQTFSSYKPHYGLSGETQVGEGASYSFSPDWAQVGSAPSIGHGPIYTNFSNFSNYSDDDEGTDTDIDADSIKNDGARYKCSRNDCTAQPFRTQSLLDSHVRVHSPYSTYCCPVTGCPRSNIGKGFRRKWGMSRHLVMQHSFYYLCPFCQGQASKYSRLLSMRVHLREQHPDKHVNNPAFQEAISQPRRIVESDEPPGFPRIMSPADRQSTEQNIVDEIGRRNVTTLPSIQNLLIVRHISDIGMIQSNNIFQEVKPASLFPAALTDHQLTSESFSGIRSHLHSSQKAFNDQYLEDSGVVAFENCNQHISSDPVVSNSEAGKLLEGLWEEIASGSYVSDSERIWLEKGLEGESSETGGMNLAVVREAAEVSETRETSVKPSDEVMPHYNHSDSGYASTGRKSGGAADQTAEDWDDTETVVTDNQDLDIEEEVKKKLSLALSSDMIGHIKSSIQEYEHRSMKKVLSGSLKDFAIKLRQNASPGQQTDATIFVRHHRHRIAGLLEDSLKVLSLKDDCGEPLGKDNPNEVEDDNGVCKEKGLSVTEKMALWSNSPSMASKKHFEAVAEEDDDEPDDYVIDRFPDTWKFLTESNAYQWLLGKIKSEITLTDSDGTLSQKIRDEVQRGFDSMTVDGKYAKTMHTAIFRISWSLRAFLTDEYPGEDELKLGSIITITGSYMNAQATTCSEYMKQVWPTTGLETLAIVQAAVTERHEHGNTWVTIDGSQISLTLTDSTAIAIVKGTQPAVAEIGQQLAWLAAALRSSSSKNSPSLSTSHINLMSAANKTPAFDITCHVTAIESNKNEPPLNGTCWQDLFHNPVIVQGFPILARTQDERGLEIPLNMMSGLGQACRATNFDGGIVIKGLSTMFCPTKRVKNSVLWHYLHEKDDSRISYLAADERCQGRLKIDRVDTACLRMSRNFLGWASSVEINTGTKDVKYDEIEWPKPNFASAGIALEKASIIVGEYISGGASFTRGNKDTPLYLRREGPYEVEIKAAANMNVVIYNTGERRAWLVDGAMALLHLTRTQLSSSPYSESSLFTLSDFNHPSPTDGASGARMALLNSKNREVIVFQDTETYIETKIGIGDAREEKPRITTKNWTYQHLVREAYHKLEQIHDYETKALTCSSINLRFTDRDKLTGFAFMDIVDGEKIIRPRVAILKPSGKGWVDFTRSIRAITLLGRGFGELITPARDANSLCTHWKHVPSGEDYLTACTSTLKDICRKYGDHDSKPMELSTGVFWHKPDKLFESCACKSGKIVKPCDRLQVLLPPSLGFKTHPQPFGYPKGAVIFGRSKRLPWSWPSRGNPVEGAELESENEESVEFCDSGIGDSNPPSANDTPSETLKSFPSTSSDGVPSTEMEDLAMSGGLGDVRSTPLSSISSSQQKDLESLDRNDTTQTSGSSGSDEGEVVRTAEEVGESSVRENRIPSGDDVMLDVQHDQSVRTRGTKRTWERVKEAFPTKRSRQL